MPTETNTFPEWTPRDLADPTLFRVNADVAFIYSQLNKVQTQVAGGLTGPAGPVGPEGSTDGTIEQV